MKKSKQTRKNRLDAPGSTIKDFFRSMFIGHGGSTQDSVHVRDAIDVKRTMTLVGLCLLPTILLGIYNTGLQAKLAIIAGASAANSWQSSLFSLIFKPLSADTGAVATFSYGLCYFLPIYLVALLMTLLWEMVFAKARKQDLHEGFFVTALLFSLCMPAHIALWLVVLGVSFGVVVAKELFGGMGYNFLNPALAGLAFIYFAYPAEVTTSAQLVAVDGYSGATTLAQVAANKLHFTDYAWYQAFSDASWWQAFLGFEVGAIGETSTLAILLGGGLLLLTRLADWRIVAGVMLGMIVSTLLFNYFGNSRSAWTAMPWTWHLVTGGFALGMMFMATDPVTTAYTRPGKLLFGILVGAMTVVIRIANVKMPEGIMLAILFANLWAPLMDSLVARFNIRRRIKRNGLQ
ncbi:NADH:ubiquinone reductase (Na(+)-transporting) subunit B [Shewanella yunxiaonensis]|uniref:NADH:ubiquinone reductase (Na(+)-transporting) subunit B n=1 Tax=Shewanella yunxiaonensis TaxID=2829809 RepID=A0ABX7YRW3_9GAMM|nr:NADH:ubiquinone reductase (Na(+)-transporting) subunit B [Shewanella yunxiaonensis]QUN05472.1 NADH:ubiquinone reductase (Na(+)-transporting) subunit B [Shewanella yunxiaonensis]